MAIPFSQRNFQNELEQLLDKLAKEGRVPSLLLHSCCAPCSSYVIEYLSRYFNIVVFYYNPNISVDKEYKKRVEEQKRFINEFPALHKVRFIEGDYEPDLFFDKVKGYEDCAEGGERCFICYRMRLEKTARLAKQMNMDYFTTTLTISPLKNSFKLNEIGLELEKEYGVCYLLSDFKKREGYKRSIQLSGLYHLYRQDYCGCVFSYQQRQRQRN